MKPFTVSAYRDLARNRLPKEVFDYIDGAAGDELTNRRNEQSYDNISLRPLCLRDVSGASTLSQLFGAEFSAPILVGPTAFHQLANACGEVGTAQAAKALGLPMIASSMSNFSLEEIALQSGHPSLWLQCYIFQDRKITEALVRRAEDAGYKALVLTVGIPIHGKRTRDLQNQFVLPSHCTTGNFKSRVNDDEIYDFTANTLSPNTTWDDVEWLRSLTSLPLLIKGILNPRDAEQACRAKVSGIIVSNHGGRQLDTSEATISVLPEIAACVSDQIPILIDGGISRGTDVFKAIALGADAVLLGRPILWALAVNGAEGVEALLTLLCDDFKDVMKLAGCRTVGEIKELGSDICPISAKAKAPIYEC